MYGVVSWMCYRFFYLYLNNLENDKFITMGNELKFI